MLRGIWLEYLNIKKKENGAVSNFFLLRKTVVLADDSESFNEVEEERFK